MRKRFLSLLQYFIFLGGGIFLVWWQLKSMTAIQREEFMLSLRDANYWLIIPIIIMSMLSHLSRSMRWKLLMEPLKYEPKLKNVFAVTMVGYLVNAAIPRLGEIIKCTFLARYEKLKVDKLVGTIIVERAFDLLCYVAFIGITVAIQINVIGSAVKTRLKAMAASEGFPLWGKFLLFFAGLIFIIYLVKLLFKKYPQNIIVFRVNNFIRGTIEGFKSIKNLKHRRAFILHTLFIWLMYLLQIYLGFSAMDGTDHLSVKAAFSVLTLATLAMIATPGGIGSFPIFVMQTLIIYQIPASLGKAFGWLLWGVSTGIVLAAGIIALLVLPYINKKKHEVSPVDPV